MRSAENSDGDPAENTLLIRNCRLIKDGKEEIKDIYISGGIIRRICSPSPSDHHPKPCSSSSGHGRTAGAEADRVIDACRNFVIPGIIDPHVHFREPGLTHKEDLYTGSRAAASGGITTFIDMPNTVPPTLTYFELEEKRFLAKKSLVNYGFYIGASKDNLAELKKANQDENIAGTKLFMNLSTGKMMIDDPDTIMEVFTSSKLVAVHAEGPKVEEAIKYAIRTGTRLYLCHISTAAEIDTIRRYRRGNEWARENVYVEVTPHHLFLTDHDYAEQGAFAKMIPSLKTKADQEALWRAISDGTVDTIGTDHAPHTENEKRSDNPPGGVTGEETMLPLMLGAIARKRLSLERLVALTSRNPARIFRIKNKGAIGEGYDADLVIIDTELEREVVNDKLETKCRLSPFNGWNLKGWPVATIVGGNVVFDHGKIYNNQGREAVFGRGD